MYLILVSILREIVGGYRGDKEMKKKQTRMIAAGLSLCILACTIGVGVFTIANGFLAFSGGMEVSDLPYQDSLPHKTNTPDSWTGPDVVEHRIDLVSGEVPYYPFTWRIITPE